MKLLSKSFFHAFHASNLYKAKCLVDIIDRTTGERTLFGYHLLYKSSTKAILDHLRSKTYNMRLQDIDLPPIPPFLKIISIILNDSLTSPVIIKLSEHSVVTKVAIHFLEPNIR